VIRTALPASLLAALLLCGCPASSEDSVALADQPKGVRARPVDLEALAAARAASEGAQIEDELAEARALNANVKAYANKEGEPTLADRQAAGAPPSEGPQGVDPFAGASAGSQAPSDLDTLDDAPAEAWVNMKLVEQRILGKTKAMQACWDNHGDGGSARIEMAITIGSSGRATSVSMSPSSTSRNGEVADCVARALRSVSYPEPTGGPVSFVYPVKF
jgi:hypothetical protein